MTAPAEPTSGGELDRLPQGSTHDFDAWRAERDAARQARTATIFGRETPIPTSISIDLSMRIDDADDEDVDLVSELIGELYGPDALAHWRTAGCTVADFAVLLAWGSEQAQGNDVTFADAAEAIAEGKGGEVPNRAQRRNRAKRKRKR